MPFGIVMSHLAVFSNKWIRQSADKAIITKINTEMMKQQSFRFICDHYLRAILFSSISLLYFCAFQIVQQHLLIQKYNWCVVWAQLFCSVLKAGEEENKTKFKKKCATGAREHWHVRQRSPIFSFIWTLKTKKIEENPWIIKSVRDKRNIIFFHLSR